MDEYEVYNEKVPSVFLSLILIISGLGMLAFTIYYRFYSEPDSVLIITLIYTPMGILFVAMGFNFTSIDIEVTNKQLHVRYGVFKRSYLHENITAVEIDETYALRYGGFGIRKANVVGKKTLVYNVIGEKKVYVDLVNEKVDRFVFSVKDPEIVIQAIENARKVAKND